VSHHDVSKCCALQQQPEQVGLLALVQSQVLLLVLASMVLVPEE
jgi:hypothetical protein